MKFIGVDLHKKTISLCVVVVAAGKREVLSRRRFDCQKTAAIRKFFEEQGAFQVVVEATANYEWFLLLVEDLADRCVLAHPKKLRVIAECKHKSDKVDAQILAEFLAMDMIPEAYRPSPRIRQYRVLVRYRHYIQGRITSLKCKLRDKAAHYNADIAELFTLQGERHLAEIAMSWADRFQATEMLALLRICEKQRKKVDTALLRWAMVETAWRLVAKFARWRHIFETLKTNTGSKKKAIVGVARRILCTMYAMLRDGKAYRPAAQAA